MSGSERRSYLIIPIILNGIRIESVVIDSHYEIKHRDSIDDALILKLVFKLESCEVPAHWSGRYKYFVSLVILNAKQYRVVWLLEDGSNYLGIVNIYRDDRSKKNGLSVRKRVKKSQKNT